MATKKTSTIKSFGEKLHIYIEESLSDTQKVNIAKKSYLLQNKEEIILAIRKGYHPKDIAEYATFELLKLNLPKTFLYQNKEGESIEGITKITAMDVKRICEDKD